MAACMMFLVGCQSDDEGTSATHYYTISTDDMSWGRADMTYIADPIPWPASTGATMAPRSDNSLWRSCSRWQA